MYRGVKTVRISALEEEEDKQCPACGGHDTWRNSCGEIQCDNCGYEETY